MLTRFSKDFQNLVLQKLEPNDKRRNLSVVKSLVRWCELFKNDLLLDDLARATCEDFREFFSKKTDKNNWKENFDLIIPDPLTESELSDDEIKELVDAINIKLINDKGISEDKKLNEISDKDRVKQGILHLIRELIDLSDQTKDQNEIYRCNELIENIIDCIENHDTQTLASILQQNLAQDTDDENMRWETIVQDIDLLDQGDVAFIEEQKKIELARIEKSRREESALLLIIREMETNNQFHDAQAQLNLDSLSVRALERISQEVTEAVERDELKTHLIYLISHLKDSEIDNNDYLDVLNKNLKESFPQKRQEIIADAVIYFDPPSDDDVSDDVEELKSLYASHKNHFTKNAIKEIQQAINVRLGQYNYHRDIDQQISKISVGYSDILKRIVSSRTSIDRFNVATLIYANFPPPVEWEKYSNAKEILLPPQKIAEITDKLIARDKAVKKMIDRCKNIDFSNEELNDLAEFKLKIFSADTDEDDINEIKDIDLDYIRRKTIHDKEKIKEQERSKSIKNSKYQESEIIRQINLLDENSRITLDKKININNLYELDDKASIRNILVNHPKLYIDSEIVDQLLPESLERIEKALVKRIETIEISKEVESAVNRVITEKIENNQIEDLRPVLSSVIDRKESVEQAIRRNLKLFNEPYRVILTTGARERITQKLENVNRIAAQQEEEYLEKLTQEVTHLDQEAKDFYQLLNRIIKSLPNEILEEIVATAGNPDQIHELINKYPNSFVDFKWDERIEESKIIHSGSAASQVYWVAKDENSSRKSKLNSWQNSEKVKSLLINANHHLWLNVIPVLIEYDLEDSQYLESFKNTLKDDMFRVVEDKEQITKKQIDAIAKDELIKIQNFMVTELENRKQEFVIIRAITEIEDKEYLLEKIQKIIPVLHKPKQLKNVMVDVFRNNPTYFGFPKKFDFTSFNLEDNALLRIEQAMWDRSQELNLLDRRQESHQSISSEDEDSIEMVDYKERKLNFEFREDEQEAWNLPEMFPSLPERPTNVPTPNKFQQTTKEEIEAKQGEIRKSLQRKQQKNLKKIFKEIENTEPEETEKRAVLQKLVNAKDTVEVRKIIRDASRVPLNMFPNIGLNLLLKGTIFPKNSTDDIKKLAARKISSFETRDVISRIKSMDNSAWKKLETNLSLKSKEKDKVELGLIRSPFEDEEFVDETPSDDESQTVSRNAIVNAFKTLEGNNSMTAAQIDRLPLDEDINKIGDAIIQESKNRKIESNILKKIDSEESELTAEAIKAKVMNEDDSGDDNVDDIVFSSDAEKRIDDAINKRIERTQQTKAFTDRSKAIAGILSRDITNKEANDQSHILAKIVAADHTRADAVRQAIAKNKRKFDLIYNDSIYKNAIDEKNVLTRKDEEKLYQQATNAYYNCEIRKTAIHAIKTKPFDEITDLIKHLDLNDIKSLDDNDIILLLPHNDEKLIGNVSLLSQASKERIIQAGINRKKSEIDHLVGFGLTIDGMDPFQQLNPDTHRQNFQVLRRLSHAKNARKVRQILLEYSNQNPPKNIFDPIGLTPDTVNNESVLSNRAVEEIIKRSAAQYHMYVCAGIMAKLAKVINKNNHLSQEVLIKLANINLIIDANGNEVEKVKAEQQFKEILKSEEFRKIDGKKIVSSAEIDKLEPIFLEPLQLWAKAEIFNRQLTDFITRNINAGRFSIGELDGQEKSEYELSKLLKISDKRTGISSEEHEDAIRVITNYLNSLVRGDFGDFDDEQAGYRSIRAGWQTNRITPKTIKQISEVLTLKNRERIIIQTLHNEERKAKRENNQAHAAFDNLLQQFVSASTPRQIREIIYNNSQPPQAVFPNIGLTADHLDDESILSNSATKEIRLAAIEERAALQDVNPETLRRRKESARWVSNIDKETKKSIHKNIKEHRTSFTKRISDLEKTLPILISSRIKEDSPKENALTQFTNECKYIQARLVAERMRIGEKLDDKAFQSSLLYGYKKKELEETKRNITQDITRLEKLLVAADNISHRKEFTIFNPDKTWYLDNPTVGQLIQDNRLEGKREGGDNSKDTDIVIQELTDRHLGKQQNLQDNVQGNAQGNVRENMVIRISTAPPPQPIARNQTRIPYDTKANELLSPIVTTGYIKGSQKKQSSGFFGRKVNSFSVPFVNIFTEHKDTNNQIHRKVENIMNKKDIEKFDDLKCAELVIEILEPLIKTAISNNEPIKIQSGDPAIVKAAMIYCELHHGYPDYETSFLLSRPTKAEKEKFDKLLNDHADELFPKDRFPGGRPQTKKEALEAGQHQVNIGFKKATKTS